LRASRWLYPKKRKKKKKTRLAPALRKREAPPHPTVRQLSLSGVRVAFYQPTWRPLVRGDGAAAAAMGSNAECRADEK
jgi:hypothetical protein